MILEYIAMAMFTSLAVYCSFTSGRRKGIETMTDWITECGGETQLEQWTLESRQNGIFPKE